ncbi:MAG TPA: SRPBCC domain-containing protein [candidate division Zixibacteria bacterium]|nr:SRPBCC domain-containing protein [candidate division Zixibacteria bacterium]
MSRLLEDVITVAAPRERVWQVVDDPNALQRVLPGCEELEMESPGHYRAVMSTRLPFLTLRVRGTATVTEVQRPEHMRLEISGQPLGLVGSFTVSVPVDLSATDDGGTRASYAVDLHLTGRLAQFGAPILRSAVKGQVREMVANLEHELAKPAAPPAGEASQP